MTLHEWERQHILSILVKTGWNLNKTAHLLRVSVAELQQKIKEHHLEQSQNVSDMRERPLKNERKEA